jgi:Spy/CpxP family protein refolding chaperone
MRFRLHILMIAFALACGSAAGAQSTKLTPSQIESIKSIRSKSDKKAETLAIQLANTAKLIYENILSDKEDESVRKQLERELDRTVVELVNLKGKSIREMVAVLTPDQKKLVRDEMKKPDAPADLSELIARLFKIPDK